MHAMIRLIQAASVAAVVVALGLTWDHAPPAARGQPSESVLRATWGADKKKKVVQTMTCSQYTAALVTAQDPNGDGTVWAPGDSCATHQGAKCIMCSADNSPTGPYPLHCVVESTKADQPEGVGLPGNVGCGSGYIGRCIMAQGVAVCRDDLPAPRDCADVVMYAGQPVDPQ